VEGLAEEAGEEEAMKVDADEAEGYEEALVCGSAERAKQHVTDREHDDQDQDLRHTDGSGG
jgi:hypothetical protein